MADRRIPIRPLLLLTSWSRRPWKPHRTQTCTIPALSTQKMWEPILWPGLECPLPWLSIECQTAGSCICLGQPEVWGEGLRVWPTRWRFKAPCLTSTKYCGQRRFGRPSNCYTNVRVSLAIIFYASPKHVNNFSCNAQVFKETTDQWNTGQKDSKWSHDLCSYVHTWYWNIHSIGKQNFLGVIPWSHTLGPPTSLACTVVA